jgi:hypothetical protein
MIQRIQTLFFLLATIALGLMLVYPIASVGSMTWIAAGLRGVPEGIQASPLLPFLLQGPILGVMSLVIWSMFSYKNRPRQLILGRIAFLLTLSLIVVIYMSVERICEGAGVAIETAVYGLSTYLPLAALAFLLLGIRGVKRDQALVGSMDRLR